jgi:hypothetical protein
VTTWLVGETLAHEVLSTEDQVIDVLCDAAVYRTLAQEAIHALAARERRIASQHETITCLRAECRRLRQQLLRRDGVAA